MSADSRVAFSSTRLQKQQESAKADGVSVLFVAISCTEMRALLLSTLSTVEIFLSCILT
uniref:Uncharacterized protein n=1 Tax=Triticum urartu TaxID=4572 RepID=A0A8R7Q7X1_TRIUA